MNKDDAANTERMVSGVKLDANGKAIGYTIKSEKAPYQYDYKDVNRFADYPGSKLQRLQYNLILTGKVQPNQRRGRPLVLPAMNDIIMMSKFSEAELVKAVIHSYITAFVERDKDLLTTIRIRLLPWMRSSGLLTGTSRLVRQARRKLPSLWDLATSRP